MTSALRCLNPVRPVCEGSIPSYVTELLAIGLRASGIGIALFAPDDTLAYASPTVAEYWDIQADSPSFSEIIRHCYRRVRGPVIESDDIEAWLRTANSKRRKVPDRSFEIDMLDGKWFWANEVMLDNGWLMLTISDITPLKAKERDISQARDVAMHWAETDALTGLHNRRHAMKRLDMFVRSGHEGDGTLSVALIDIDRFKSINDTYGHDTGDRILRHFADTARLEVRKTDLLSRVGGEEFLLILPQTELDEAQDILNRLRVQIASSWPLGTGLLQYSFSAGMVSLQPGEKPQDILRRADRTLYRAKHLGRNRVETDH